MAKNRYYTVMIVPEKTALVRRFVVPAWVLRGTAIGLAAMVLIALIMLADYGFVMGQIGENKQLKLENRRLRQEAQVFKEKIASIESTVERMKTFATRLKVITNTEDRASLLQRLNSSPAELPDSSANVTVAVSQRPHPDAPPPPITEDEAYLRGEQERLGQSLNAVAKEALFVEQMLQDENELLSDKKSFLAATPTRKPADGHFTSGFGVRTSPFGGRIKMHEGLDIANAPGTLIHAPADGVVAFADAKPGYGRTLVIDHGYGVETWYGHTRQILVSRGQKVRRGDNIALLGNTGRSTGPHVHYEVRVHGTPVDPLTYILEN